MGKYVHENTVPADTVAEIHIGFAAEAHPAAISEAVAVIVEQTGATNAQWNVLLEGQQLFDPAGINVQAADTPELFVPNAGNRANLRTANATAEIQADIDTAGTGQLHMTVLTDDNRED